MLLRCSTWKRAALGFALLSQTALASMAWGADAKAPDWPNLLSEPGRRAAMALPKSHPMHLEPTLDDLAAEEVSVNVDAKASYDAWLLAAGTPPNVRANNPVGDVASPAADTQSECAVAAFGNNVVVAWNDSKGLRLGTPTTVTSYAYSCDGGATFTDGGDVPLIAAGNQSFGDCTLDVDANGNFYLGVIYVGATQDVAVYRGTFGGGCSFTWNTPVIAASGAGGALDKPYLCVDPANGNVYVSYTRFAASTSIEVVRGTGLGTVWSSPVVLETASGIQGSRPIVGPEGNLYVCWQAGWGTINCDLSSTVGTIRLRRSTNPAGAFTFGAAVVVGTAEHNWTSYYAGNLRSNAIYFPDMAVDRSGGPHNGNVYVTWHEAGPWGPPGNGTGVSTAETESNNNATDVNVKTINPGDNATGTISASTDLDYWKITLTAGQTIMLRLEPQGFNCGVAGTTRNFRLRVYRGIAGTAGDSILANSNLNGFASECVFDVPTTDTYLFRVQNVNSSGTVSGTYTVKSRLLAYGAPQPGRDMRDIVVARSTNLGLSFGAPVRVNDDAAGLDNCIPAITCDNLGKVHVFWYDSRNATGARILRSYYRAVSLNGGVTYQPNQRVSDQLMYFNLNTVAVPNYGEYNQAASTGSTVYASWSDERLANAPVGQSGVDAYVAKLASCVTVSCAPDQTVESGQVVNLNLCITNCGTFSDDFSYSIGDDQGWCTPAAGSVTIAAGATTCIPVTCNVPPAAPDGTMATITLSTTSVSCPTATASCTTKLTVQNPPTGVPGPGFDCFQSTAQVQVEIYGFGTTTLNLSGPAMVKRAAPVVSGPGFQIQTEIVEMNLTGFDPGLGAVTVRESPLLVSRGSIQTGPPSGLYPADSFFDVFFEIDTPLGTLFNKNRLRLDAVINAIPPVGDPYQGNDILLYRKGADEATVVGRVLQEIHTPGPPFDWFPPPGVDCLNTTVDLVVDIIGLGIDNLQGTGPILVSRGAAFDPGDGRPQIQTEMLSMELTGNGPLVGPFRLIESPVQLSPGLVKSQAPGNPYPVDSFFDVFFEIELPSFGRTAIGVGPAQMHLEGATAIPPLGQPFLLQNPVQLIDKDTLVPLGTLNVVRHIPDTPFDWAPPPDIDCFNSTAQVRVEVFGLGIDTVNLSGPTMVARGPAVHTGGGNHVIDTEMLSMNLTGSSPLFGAVTVEEDIAKASTGQAAFSALNPVPTFDSFFDVFFVLTTPAGVLRPQVPVRMANPAVGSLPPPPGTNYQGINNPIDLVDSAGNVRGRLLVEIHTTGTPFIWITDAPGDLAEGPFYGLRGAYPNPFKLRTSVSLRLDRERQVRMRIYNVRGEVVRTVADSRLGAGLRVLHWDGKDDSGAKVGTGVYFYRVDVDGESVTRKVIKMQ